jgi:D-glycero-alpha-D-manno-heptose 1-phosphate guanylyltransferase
VAARVGSRNAIEETLSSILGHRDCVLQLGWFARAKGANLTREVHLESTLTTGMRDEAKAVLLVGGMGTRLRSVLPDTPKPLASVGEKSFLDLLVRQLRSQGIRQLVMCTGYLAEQIESELGDGHAWDVAIEYSRETHALGTAGAVKLAERYLRDVPEFLVMNGDSFLEIDFHELIHFHRQHCGLASIAVWRATNAARYGTVQLGASSRVTGFVEKAGGESAGLINAGVYVFSRAVLEHIPDAPASLEKEVFPDLLDHGIYAMEQHGMFIDIGTPEDYARAQRLFDNLNDAALRGQRSV